MEKLIYLCWKRANDSIERFRGELIETVSPRLLQRGARSLTLNIADLGDEIAGSPLILGEGRTLSASVSLWLESIDERAAHEQALSEISSQLWGYLVTESAPLRWQGRDWPDGVKSPGASLITVFPKPDRLSDEQFYGHWYGSHTPLSFEIHPFTQYIRNAVARRLTAEGAPYRGIVEERVGEARDVVDIMRLFRGSVENMKRGMEDVAKFLDADQIGVAIMNEYIIKS